jgi:glycosyltransferase involved in cell wall biosynthesis
MKIRVLHVIDHLGYGGAPFVVKNLVERMPTDRIESHVCALRANPRPLAIDAVVTTLQSGKYSPAAVRAIAHLCKTQQIDIVHAHLQKGIISSLLATFLYKGRLILHEHGPIFRGGTGCLYRAVIRLLGPRADAIIANSEAAKSAVLRTLHGREVPVTVVANFIDLERFNPDLHDRAAARRSLGLGDDEFVAGFVGRLDRAKGADLLIDAAAILKAQGDAWRFVVVGDGPERRRLEAQAQRLGLAATVLFAGLQEDTAAVVRAFDVGVVPSRREAFGIAALELMRMKVPVIVSPVGGLPELVQDGQTGILLSRLDARAIAQAIQRLAGDGDLRAMLGRGGFERAGRFDGREAVRQTVEVYERLMAGKKQDRDAQGQTRGT